MRFASPATAARRCARTRAGGNASSDRALRAHFLRILALTCLLAAPAGTARAQAVYGSLAGTVTDASGAVVPGVAVTTKSADRNTSDTVHSNAFGFYVKERLLPGAYEVSAEIAGFRRAVFTDVLVSVDSQTTLDIRLELGALADAVSVSGQTPLLKTDRADVATTFEAAQILELPNIDRNFTRLVLLTPGTQRLLWQHSPTENPQGSIQIMVNGQHFGGTGYQLDGTENRDPILGIIVINPNLEAIAEAKVTSQNYDAEFGQAIAGVASVQTRSGTNVFRGSAFEFYQDDAFQARNPFTQAEPDPVSGEFLPDTGRHQFGGSIGGPVKRDRIFFFGDYAGARGKTGGSRLLTVPTARARMGDLGEYEVPIFDPATTIVDASGSLLSREQFSNGRIPSDRLSSQAQALLGLIPLPNRTGVQNGTRDNFVAAGSEVFDSDSFDVRLDGRLTSRMNAFGRYSLADFRRDAPTAFGEGGGPAVVSGVGGGGRSKARNQSLAAGVDRMIGASMAADLRFGYFRYRVNKVPVGFGTSPARDAGIPGVNSGDASTSGLPLLFVGGDRGFNFGSGLFLDQDEQQWQIVGNVTKAAGRHLLKAGVDVRHAYNRRVPREASFLFGSDRTRGPLGGGLGLATLLLGDVTWLLRRAGRTTDAAEEQWRHFYYVQDTWRASSRWTFNYGLRLDVINPQTVNGAGNGGFLDLDTGEIKVAGIGGIGLDGGVENTLNWAPRLAFTYQLTGRTVLRAGYGRSYDIGTFGSLFGHVVTQNPPVLVNQNLGDPTSFNAVFNLAEGPPLPVFPDVPSDGRIPLPPGELASAVTKKQRLPRVDAYNATIQHLLSDAISIEVGYVGNKGTHVFAGDAPDPDANEPSLTGFPEVPRQARQPYFARFGWTQEIRYYCNCADNRYDSLQAKLVKRFADGWSLLAHYTLQRIVQDDAVQFVHNRDLNRGRPDWDRRHSVVFAATCELPFGRARWFGGWQVNAVATVLSGLPFEVTYRDASVDRDVGPNRPNLVGDPTVDEPTRDRWFNTTPIGSPGSAFARPASGTFGDLPRNALRGPGYWRVDASLFKSFRLGGDAEMELRMEAVNVFNHVNLGNPDAEIGVPGNDNPNAGRITSTAYFGTDPQRTWQFGLRLTF